MGHHNNKHTLKKTVYSN